MSLIQLLNILYKSDTHSLTFKLKSEKENFRTLGELMIVLRTLFDFSHSISHFSLGFANLKIFMYLMITIMYKMIIVRRTTERKKELQGSPVEKHCCRTSSGHFRKNF